MKKLLVTLVLFVTIAFVAVASNVEGSSTYQDYLFILVHGINGGSHHFNGQDHNHPEWRLLQELKKPVLQGGLGLDGHVYAYSFKDNKGSSVKAAREFGDRTYNNNASYIDEKGNLNSMNGKCWLDKAREDFREWFKKHGPGKEDDRYPIEEEIPSKYIIITHSMGNMPVRLYIYSKDLMNLQPNLYANDIDKVVFIAPPLTGSDLALLALVPKSFVTAYLAKMKVEQYSKWAQKIAMSNFLVDPYMPYKVTKDISFWLINSPLLFNTAKGFVGADGQPIDLLEGGNYGVLNDGTWELIPDYMLSQWPKILDAKLSDDTQEPSYSIVYGRGSPVPNAKDSIKNYLLKGFLKEQVIDKYGPNMFPLTDADVVDMNEVYKKYVGTSDMFKFESGFDKFYNEDLVTLMPGSAFYSLSTSQAKFFSLVMSNDVFQTNVDGDCAVSVNSAKGIMDSTLHLGELGKGTRAIKNAKFYEKIYSGKFNAYLDNEFPSYVSGAALMYAGLCPFVGHQTALSISQWSLSVAFLIKVAEYSGDIQHDYLAHGTILTEYDLIKTAILDTPAIFTINDLQTTLEVGVSDEATTLAFSISSPEAGYYSIKAKGITENRTYHGLSAMAVPSTVNNDRKYIASITLTKAPVRITGKLNYLMPKLMKSFEYSFNFAAWKPIENVDPETGEFVLDNLPFAEGQNVIAIRSENAVGVKSHQHNEDELVFGNVRVNRGVEDYEFKI